MKSQTTEVSTSIVEADLLRQQARNDKLMELLKTIEALWPTDEKGKVQSLLSQTEATKSLLDDFARQLEEKRRG